MDDAFRGEIDDDFKRPLFQIALNHFNKAAKGRLTRALAESSADLADTAQFVRWASDAGFETAPDGDVMTLILPPR